MPRGFCWFWWLTAPYWYPYFQRFWRAYPWLPWWAWIYGSPTPYTEPSMTKEQEIAFLEEQGKLIEEELDYINKRLEELRR